MNEGEKLSLGKEELLNTNVSVVGSVAVQTARLKTIEPAPLRQAYYELVGTDLRVTVSRDRVTQLINIELSSNNAKRGYAAHGRWSVTAYQVASESITIGKTQVKISVSPFYFEVRFYQRTLGIYTEMASMVIKPKVLRPGDVPVSLVGAWITHGGASYDGHIDFSTPTHTLTRYSLNESNVEVWVGKDKTARSFFVQVVLKDSKGACTPIATIDSTRKLTSSSEMKVLNLSIIPNVDSKGVSLKFMDRTLGMFPTEVGYIAVENVEIAGVKAVPLYLSGNWAERGVNFDKQFA